jgi:hypothetical protein
MQSRSYLDKPTHEHDCEECEFQFGIRITVKEKFDDITGDVHVVDVYKQCDGEEKYLLRWSSDGPDYHSGVRFRDLCAGYFSFHHGLR